MILVLKFEPFLAFGFQTMAAIQSKELINRRLLAILFFGFSSGLPFTLTGSTLQAWFTEAHINLITIGTLSLLGIPYTFKFLWAPLMDHFSFPFLGKRQGWILLMQAGLFITLMILALMDPHFQASQMGFVALLVVFFSASQDISINAYTTDALAPEERGLGAAYTVFTFRIATLVSGGLALIFADHLGWKTTYEIMAFLILLSMVPTFLAPRAVEYQPETKNVLQTTVVAFLDLLQREKIVLLLLFIIFYKFGDALALQLMTNFLLHGLGFTLTEVGMAYKVVGLVAMILGGFVGGVILMRWNMYIALLAFGLAQAFSNLMFVILALAGKHFILMTSTLFIENFCSGLSTAALLAFIMSLCDHRFTASQFALLSAAASLGRVFLGPLAGLMVENLGWVQFYIWAFVACFPGIIFLILLKEKVSYRAHATVD